MVLQIGRQEFSVRLGRGGRVQCEPAWHLGPDWAALLDDYDLWFVWQGRGRMKTAGGDFQLRPGSLFWMRPGGRYEADHDPAAPLGVTYLHFTLGPAGGRPRSRRWQPPFEALQVPRWDVLDGVMSRILARSREPGGLRLAETWLATLLADLVHEHRVQGRVLTDAGLDLHHRERIQGVADRVRERPGAAPSVALLAREAGYSVDHFSRLFRRIMGERPQAYVIRCKLERACALLAESGMSVGMVADALGFRDIFYFSRQFRNKLGVSPSAYRAGLVRRAS
jgi:AraC-like DNA-binding protein